MKKILIVFLVAMLSACSNSKPILKIGLVADPQYADKATVGKRNYKESVWKLEQAVDTFNSNKVDFVQTLGDVIDEHWASFDAILPVYEKLNNSIGNYHALGNHDYSIDSIHTDELLSRLKMPDYYYSYEKSGWRFIVLDATDYAYYSNVVHNRAISKINAFFDKSEGNNNHYPWNGAIGTEQQMWLKTELEKAKKNREKVILFSHLPIRPLENSHNLWNDHEIAELIEKYSNVVAFINGHNHAGNYQLKNGVHYVTMFGMVDTDISSFGILKIYDEILEIQGFGHQENLSLKIESD